MPRVDEHAQRRSGARLARGIRRGQLADLQRRLGREHDPALVVHEGERHVDVEERGEERALEASHRDIRPDDSDHARLAGLAVPGRAEGSRRMHRHGERQDVVARAEVVDVRPVTCACLVVAGMRYHSSARKSRRYSV